MVTQVRKRARGQCHLTKTMKTCQCWYGDSFGIISSTGWARLSVVVTPDCVPARRRLRKERIAEAEYEPDEVLNSASVK